MKQKRVQEGEERQQLLPTQKTLQSKWRTACITISPNVTSNSRIAELEKKIKELNDQIRVYKNELSDKQKEFAQEKADLQSVIDQQKKGGEAASNAELDKVKKDLEKAQKELQEGAVEKERFQAQLEMLVQELEQKQVILVMPT